MHPLFWLTPVASILALLFAWYLFLSVRKFDEGTDVMREIAQAVRELLCPFNRKFKTGVIQGCCSGMARMP
jgi:Na+/H+-translocating membrane pyrophosphatase